MFFNLVDCHLAAQIADFGQNGPTVGQPSLALSISMQRWPIFAQKICIDERDNNLDGSFTMFYITIVYKS
jgi:hypothetical protein